MKRESLSGQVVGSLTTFWRSRSMGCKIHLISQVNATTRREKEAKTRSEDQRKEKSKEG